MPGNEAEENSIKGDAGKEDRRQIVLVDGQARTCSSVGGKLPGGQTSPIPQSQCIFVDRRAANRRGEQPAWHFRREDNAPHVEEDEDTAARCPWQCRCREEAGRGGQR